MIDKAKKLKERLNAAGWEIVETRRIGQLWVAEIWRLRSKWTPIDLIVYLTFEIDFQMGPREIDQVDQVVASLKRPVDWLLEDGEAEIFPLIEGVGHHPQLFLGRGRRKYLDEFISELSALRNDSVDH